MKKTREKKFLPTLYPINHDFAKKWFVKYYYEAENGQLKQRKYYGDLNKYENLNARLKAAASIIDYFKEFNSPPPTKQGNRKVYLQFSSSKTPLFSFLDEYLKEKKPTIRKSSYASYTSKIKSFKNWLIDNEFTEMKPDDFNEFMIKTFIHQLDASNSTKNAYLILLSNFFKTLKKRKLIKNNPCEYIERLPAFSEPLSAFTNQQAKILKEYMSKHDAQLLLFCQMQYYTFLRPAELRLLKIKDIIMNADKIEVPAINSKNKKHQFVAIPKQLSKILSELNLHEYSNNDFLFSKKDLPGATMLGKNNMTTRFRKILTQFKFSDRYSLYSWKHTGASNCAINGMPIKQLQMQLRHHSLDQVNQYLQSLGVADMKNIRNNFPSM